MCLVRNLDARCGGRRYFSFFVIGFAGDSAGFRTFSFRVVPAIREEILKITPISPASGATFWLFQGPPAESKLLAIRLMDAVIICTVVMMLLAIFGRA